MFDFNDLKCVSGRDLFGYMQFISDVERDEMLERWKEQNMCSYCCHCSQDCEKSKNEALVKKGEGNE